MKVKGGRRACDVNIGGISNIVGELLLEPNVVYGGVHFLCLSSPLQEVLQPPLLVQ